MKPAALLVLLTASLAAWALPGAHGPDGAHLATPATGYTDGLGRLPDGSVHVPKAAQRRLGIRTTLTTVRQVAGTVVLPGRVLADPDASGRVQTGYGGRIEPGPQGLPVVGQRVRQGDILAYVRFEAAPYARGALEAELDALRAERELAEQRARRLAGLAGTVARKDIEAARVQAASLARRERRLAASLQARETLRAPLDGVVTATELVRGQVVQPQDVLVRIVDPARVLVEADTAAPALVPRVLGAGLEGLPGLELSLLGSAGALRDGLLPLMFRVGRAPDAPHCANTETGRPPAEPGRPVAGDSSAAAPCALPLAVGQPVNVLVRRAPLHQGVVLPAESLARSPANEPVVWVKSAAERFRPQPVSYRPLDAARVVVTAGLRAGERVVVRGASLLAQIR